MEDKCLWCTKTVEKNKIQRYAMAAVIWAWVAVLDIYMKWYYFALPALVVSAIYFFRVFRGIKIYKSH